MRRFTLIIVAALVAATASFAQANNSKEQRRALGKRHAFELKSNQPTKVQQAERMASPFAASTPTMAKAPKKSADYTTDQTPAGTQYDLISDYVIDSYWGGGQSSGQGILTLVVADDGTLWIKGLTPGAYGTLYWVKADPTGNGGEYVVEQQLAAYYSYYDEYDEVARVEYDEASGEYVPAEDTSFKVYFDDGEFSIEDGVIYGLIYDDGGNYVWEGDSWLSFAGAPNTLTINELPEGAVVENYALKHLEGAKAVQVAFVGDQVYIKTTDLAEGWIVGTVSGNQVIIENEQYLGYCDYYGTFLYLITGSTYEAWDDYYEEYYLAGKIEEKVVFEFDTETKTFTAAEDAALFINGAVDRVYYAERYIAPEFALFVEVAAVPADPQITYWWAFDEDYGFAELDFVIPNVDVDGNLINTDKLSYLFFVDGEQFLFETDEYEMAEDLEEVPYGFSSDDGYIGASYLALFFDPAEKVGMQSIYRGTDVENRSNIVWYDIATGETSIEPYDNTTVGVKDIADNSQAKASIYDLQGRRASSNAKGLLLMSNGQKVVKVVRK